VSSTAGAVAAALGAATLFGLATALQHHQARVVAPDASPGLLVTLARRPLWLLGMAADVVAVALQGLALALGSVALVQVLLVAGLPLAALTSAALHRRRPRRLETVGVLLCAVGLAVLGPALSSTPSTHTPGRAAALLAGVVVAAVALPLVALRSRPRFGPAFAGTAAGILVGAGAVLLAVTTTRLERGEPVLTTWAPYAAAAVGLVGLLVVQIAFQTGELGAPLAALSVVDPLAAGALAVAVLHESVPTSGGRLAAVVVGGALVVAEHDT
jgi:drug/metabolite transporter (DMT)-like permease